MEQTGLLTDIAKNSNDSQSPKHIPLKSKKLNDDLKEYFLKNLKSQIMDMHKQAQTSGVRSPRNQFQAQ